MLVARYFGNSGTTRERFAKALAANGAAIDLVAGTWVKLGGHAGAGAGAGTAVGGTISSAILNSLSKKVVEIAVDAAVVIATGGWSIDRNAAVAKEAPVQPVANAAVETGARAGM